MSNPYAGLDYEVYLTTLHWRNVRQRKLGEVGYRCEKCDRDKGLEVHHLTYERLGQESLEDLQVLCPICHREAHGMEPTAADWARARFVRGNETLKAHAQLLRQRQSKRE